MQPFVRLSRPASNHGGGSGALLDTRNSKQTSSCTPQQLAPAVFHIGAPCPGRGNQATFLPADAVREGETQTDAVFAIHSSRASEPLDVEVSICGAEYGVQRSGIIRPLRQVNKKTEKKRRAKPDWNVRFAGFWGNKKKPTINSQKATVHACALTLRWAGSSLPAKSKQKRRSLQLVALDAYASRNQWPPFWLQVLSARKSIIRTLIVCSQLQVLYSYVKVRVQIPIAGDKYSSMDAAASTEPDYD